MAAPHGCRTCGSRRKAPTDRKSTRLNSSHSQISYAVFCLKKKKNNNNKIEKAHISTPHSEYRVLLGARRLTEPERRTVAPVRTDTYQNWVTCDIRSTRHFA